MGTIFGGDDSCDEEGRKACVVDLSFEDFTNRYTRNEDCETIGKVWECVNTRHCLGAEDPYRAMCVEHQRRVNEYNTSESFVEECDLRCDAELEDGKTQMYIIRERHETRVWCVCVSAEIVCVFSDIFHSINQIINLMGFSKVVHVPSTDEL